MSYKNSNLVNIIVDINYKDLLKAGKDYICIHNLLNIIEEFVYNYYLNTVKNIVVTPRSPVPPQNFGKF